MVEAGKTVTTTNVEEVHNVEEIHEEEEIIEQEGG